MRRIGIVALARPSSPYRLQKNNYGERQDAVVGPAGDMALLKCSQVSSAFEERLNA
jgi:hypothetical protein